MSERRSVNKNGGLNKTLLIAGGLLLSLVVLFLVFALPKEEIPPEPPSAETLSTEQPEAVVKEKVESSEEPEQVEDNQPATPQTGPVSFSQNGISFTYPGELFGAATLEQSSGYPDDELSPSPGFKMVTFTSYLLPDQIWGPIIFIYSTEEYRALTEYAGETIDSLQALLADPSRIAGASELPFLPIINAAQIAHAKPEVIEFQNGSGLRYLTDFAQDNSPVTNEGLTYTFQGITSDGSFYIAAIIPVHHPELPADYNAFHQAEEAVEAFRNDYPAFLASTVQMLNETDQELFNPTLALLDEMIKSLRVELE
jgi:hypothetical protein